MPGIGRFVYPAVALLAWIMVAIQVRHVRRDRDNPSQRALLAFFACIALAVTSGSPPFWGEINSYSRYGDLATLYAQTFVVCALASVLSLLVSWNYPRERAKRQIYLRLALIAIAVAVMITLFVSVDHYHSDYTTKLEQWYAASPGFIAYLCLYQAVVAVTVIDVAQLCTRYAKRVKDQHVRTGLLVTATGAVFVLVYSLIRINDIITAQAGLAPLPQLEPVATLCSAIGAICVLIGLSYPSWADRCTAAAVYVRRYRAYRQIEPLWSAFVAAEPGIVLEPKSQESDARERSRRRAFDFKLRRRVIEIHDGELALRPYRHAYVADRARAASDGLTGLPQSAYIEATCLHAALAAKARRQRREGPGGMPEYAVAGFDPDAEPSWLTLLDEELRWLALLSKTFTRLHSTQEGPHARP
jgi:hypothetical protein